MFDDPIEYDDDIESKDLGAQSDALDVPDIEKIANSSPVAKECVAIPMDESRARDDDGC